MPPPTDPLDPLLERWKATAEPAPDLAREVWRRIALEEKGRGPGGFWADIDAWFSRPPFAAMFVACCALLGLFLAEVRRDHRQQEKSAHLARSYLQLIDPLLSTGPATKPQ
jgi:hypothetical protein